MKNTNRVRAFLLAFVMLFGTVFTWTAAAENTQTQESFTVDLSERNLIEISIELAMQLKTCEVSIETDGAQTVLDLDSDGAGDVYLLIDNAHGIFAIGTTENADRLQRNLTKTYDAGYPFSPVIFRFTDIEEYTVSYFSEHGNLPLPQTVKANEKAVEPAALTDGYYLFEGWYADSEMLTPYDFDTPVTGDLILYAKWREKTCHITFDANSGVGKMAAGEYTMSMRLPANSFTKSGYYFIGWNTKPDGSGAALNECAEITELINAADNVVLYAQWHNIYNVIEGANAKVMKGGGNGITFKTDGDYSKFTGIRIDQRNIPSEQYTSWSGSTYVQLSADLIETLSDGTHTITFLYTDGAVGAEFTVHKHEDADNDGKCDGCGEQMSGGSHCPLCGRLHDRDSIRERIIAFFHILRYTWTTLMKRLAAFLR